jgi:hypothetical protein
MSTTRDEGHDYGLYVGERAEDDDAVVICRNQNPPGPAFQASKLGFVKSR